jgi:hypothetical protein
MHWLVFLYLLATLAIAGPAFFAEAIWPGIALLFGSLMGFGAGSVMRGLFYLGNRKAGLAIGAGMLFGGMALVFHSGVIVRIYGHELAGHVWVFVGFVLGFLAAQPREERLGAATRVRD